MHFQTNIVTPASSRGTGRPSKSLNKSIKAKDMAANSGSLGQPKTAASRKMVNSGTVGRGKRQEVKPTTVPNQKSAGRGTAEVKPTTVPGPKSVGRGTATRPTSLDTGGPGKAKKLPVHIKGDCLRGCMNPCI